MPYAPSTISLRLVAIRRRTMRIATIGVSFSVLLGGLRTDRLLEIETAASDWPASHLKRSENRGRFLPLKDLHGYVVHGNAGNSLAVRGAMVGVAMKNYVSAVTIDHLS